MELAATNIEDGCIRAPEPNNKHHRQAAAQARLLLDSVRSNFCRGWANRWFDAAWPSLCLCKGDMETCKCKPLIKLDYCSLCLCTHLRFLNNPRRFPKRPTLTLEPNSPVWFLTSKAACFFTFICLLHSTHTYHLHSYSYVLLLSSRLLPTHLALLLLALLNLDFHLFISPLLFCFCLTNSFLRETPQRPLKKRVKGKTIIILSCSATSLHNLHIWSWLLELFLAFSHPRFTRPSSNPACCPFLA